jgi:hypothetical protein
MESPGSGYGSVMIGYKDGNGTPCCIISVEFLIDLGLGGKAILTF